CSQNGTGLLVDGANYGDATKGLMCDRFNHKYQIGFQSPVTAPASLKIADPDGNRTNGNSGKLTVKVYLKALVTWTFALGLQPLQQVDGKAETPAVDTRPYEKQVYIPTQTVPLPPIPTIPLPRVVFEVRSVNPNRSDCPRNLVFTLWVNGTPTSQTLGTCFPKEADYFNGFNEYYPKVGPIPGTPGGDTQLLPGTTATVVPGMYVPPTAVDLYAILAPYLAPFGLSVDKGTKVVVTFSWKADTSKMVKVASVTGGTDVWMPFGASSAAWFADPVNLYSVGATLNISLYRPNGEFLIGQGVPIPGLGQVIEAMFANQVAGK
ncbi:MAG: hypothetical protein ABIS18_10915, partial [Actinomycetota bacterium]